MNALSRLLYEYRHLSGVLNLPDFVKFILFSVLRVPDIIKNRKLSRVDSAMPGDYDITYRGELLRIPAATIDKLVEGYGEPATFGVIREMFAQDCYLRAFEGQRANTVLDFGSNRGFFMLIANKVLKAERAIGVEPEPRYGPAFAAICAQNNVDPASVYRYEAFIGPEVSENSVSVPTILAEQGLTTIDFIKCDIEGGEFPLFHADAEWLATVNNIAMEVHPKEGDVAELARVLEKYGFTVKVTDQFGNPTQPQLAHYLYASRTHFRLG